MNKDIFIEEIAKLGIISTKEKLKRLEQYFKLIIEWNQKIDLTSITGEEEVYLKHFYDSLTLIRGIDLNKDLTMCDVGTGAGFPGIVLKIFFPNLKITLIDSLNKRTKFLKEIIRELNLEDITVITSRAEDFIKENREKYDLITCRAVSKLNIISEICLPGVKVNGYFIPMKANIEEEIKNLSFLEKLGAKIKRIDTFYLPIENSARTLIVIKKEEQTKNIYPRHYSQIKKRPL